MLNDREYRFRLLFILARLYRTKRKRRVKPDTRGGVLFRERLSEYRRVLSMLAGYTTQAAHDLTKLVRGAIEELEQERQRRKGKPERA